MRISERGEQMSEEQKEGIDSPAPGGTEATEDERVTRRAFMRKAAQVGGLTALGLVGAETILPAVLERMARLAGNRSVASRIADELNRRGLLSTADANPACYLGQNYMVDCQTSPYICGTPFGSDCEGSVGYDCPWFSCTGTEFTCGHDPGDFFHCEGVGKRFICDDSTDFSCSGSSFSCTPRGLHVVDCGSVSNYTCDEGAQYYAC